MKLIKAYIHHVRTEAVVTALADAGYHNLTLHDVMGMLKPITEDERDYTHETAGLVISETRLSLVVEDSDVDKVITIIRSAAQVGPHVSGYVYVSPVDQVLPIGGPAG